MYENLIASLAAGFVDLMPEESDSGVRSALGEVGKAFGADRSFLRVFRGDPAWNPEWRAEGTPELVSEEISLSNLPWLAARLAKLEAVNLPHLGALPQEARAEIEWLERRGVRAALFVPLAVRGELVGVLGLEVMRDGLALAGEAVAVLRVVGDLLVSFLERLRAELTLDRTRERLRDARRLEALGRLTGGVAHDFNNFLTAIIGSCELLSSDLEGDPPAREEVGEIRRAAERASTLVDRVLSMSRAEATKPRAVDLNWILVDLDKLLQRLVGPKVEVVMDLSQALGTVRADPTQLEQLVVNLAANARDAMPDGGILRISTRNAQLSGRGWVMLSVEDDGCGMDEETRCRVFEPFFTTKGGGKGTGLGLATVAEIVKEHGGQVEVKSERGRGTRFTVWLPRLAPLPRWIAPRGLDTVLVVDEEPRVRRLLCAVLERHGYEVLEAACLARARELCASRAGPIALLVTDLEVPHLHGRRVAEDLVALWPRMKVLFLSSYPEQTLRQDGVIDPAAALIEKPFTSDDLACKVREVLTPERVARPLVGGATAGGIAAFD